MSRSTISRFRLSEMFPNEEAARQYIEAYRWPKGPVCPHCQEAKRITRRKGGYYRCLACKETFTVRTMTVFERSHVPLHKWIHAMYQLLTARKGVSSLQLAKEIGVQQRTAWFMLHRIREACGKDMKLLRGIVEIDETFVGELERNKHNKKKLNMGRGGRTKAMPINNTSTEEIQSAIHANVEVGSVLMTDEHAYNDLDNLFFSQERVNHSASEYVNGLASTNGIESVWTVLKRGLHGVYHQVSKKHLSRYVNEFTFRLNEGDVTRHTLERLASLVEASFGPRITYKDLTA